MDSLLMLMLGGILLIGLVLLAYIATAGKRRSGLDREYYRAQWQRVEKLQNQGDTGWQLAILEADKLLDQALKAAGYPGQTMGDRLKDARSAFRSNDQVWQAHKLRNAIAHDVNFDLVMSRGRQALDDLGLALRDLGAL